jgi:hypothetical protein
VGMQKQDDTTTPNAKAEKFNRFLEDQLGTENLIEKILVILNGE